MLLRSADSVKMSSVLVAPLRQCYVATLTSTDLTTHIIAPDLHFLARNYYLSSVGWKNTNLI